MAKGEVDLVKFLKEETGKSEKALKKSLKAEIDPQDTNRFRTVAKATMLCGSGFSRLQGWYVLTTFGYPVVIPKGRILSRRGLTDDPAARTTRPVN